MMTPTLKALLDDIVSSELNLCLLESDVMIHAQLSCLHGYKRFHRYSSRDRLGHSLKIRNAVADFANEGVSVTVTYKSPTNVGTLLDCLKMMHLKSKEHLDKLITATQVAFDDKELALYECLSCLVLDEERELDKYYRLVKELMNVNEDKTFVQLRSESLHKKYKRKESEYQGRTIK